jgi:hypothetical protein
MEGGGAAFKLDLNPNRNFKSCIRANNFEVTIGRAVCEACRATWNLGTNSTFALRLVSSEHPNGLWGLPSHLTVRKIHSPRVGRQERGAKH